MTRAGVIAAAREMIRAGHPFVLATVDARGVPQMRWMGAAMLERPLTVYMVAGARSRKTRQIRAHRRSQLMFQDRKFGCVATLSGICEIVEDPKTKRRVWKGIAASAEYFSGPEDPDFGVLRFVCRRVEVLNLAESYEPAVAAI